MKHFAHILLHCFLLNPAIFSFISGSSHQVAEGQMANSTPKRSLARPLAGGWSDSNLDDPMVLEAAEFCLQALESEIADGGQSKPAYSFAPTTDSTLKVLKASQQVVAGMNYRLTIMVLNADNCIGVFEANVYNRFGDFSVTKWSNEVSCAEGNVLLDGGRGNAD